MYRKQIYLRFYIETSYRLPGNLILPCAYYVTEAWVEVMYSKGRFIGDEISNAPLVMATFAFGEIIFIFNDRDF